MVKAGFIGTGVMGGAIIKMAVKTGSLKATDILAYDTVSARVMDIARDTGIASAQDIAQICRESRFIFICVKPAFIDDVLKEVGSHIMKGAVLISIAAGVKISRIKSFLPEDIDVIRIMPNTPLLVGEGMTVICSEAANDKSKVDIVVGIFASMGRTQELPENLMSEVIALTGSSPAYTYMLINAMAKTAAAMGIPEEISYDMGAQAVLGAAKMVLETREKPDKLINDVCSKGGTTIEAVNKLTEKGFEGIIAEAMEECVRKAYKL